ncbi:MAG: hypothetical protein RLZZ200_1835 [Pseudomonadota bacterium]
MVEYMKGRFAFFGISTPARRLLMKPFLASFGKTPDPDALLTFAEECWAFDERECQYCAVDLLVNHKGLFEPRHEPQLARLVRAKAWWDSVDLLATHVYGSLCRESAAMQARMASYSAHEDIWLRRVAILHQLGSGADTDRARLAAILSANLAHQDFFVRKAMGWALRQFARHDPDWVRNWLDAHAGRVPALTRREAMKHL